MPKSACWPLPQGILPAFPDDRRTAPPHIAYFVDIVERLRAMRQQPRLGERSVVTGDPGAMSGDSEHVEAAGIEEVILYFALRPDHTNTRRMMGAMPEGDAPFRRIARDIMPDVRSVTIIGGGVIGCFLAYRPAERHARHGH